MNYSKYQFYAIIYDVAGNQVSSKSSSSPLAIATLNPTPTVLSSTVTAKNYGDYVNYPVTLGTTANQLKDGKNH